MTISAGIPYTLLLMIEAIGSPTFGLLPVNHDLEIIRSYCLQVGVGPNQGSKQIGPVSLRPFGG